MNEKQRKKRISELVKELASLYALGKENSIENPPDTVAKITAGICVFCGKSMENEKKPRRGCHASCARSIDRRIIAGEYTSEDDAVQKGAWAIAEKGGRKFTPRPTVDDRAAEINTNDSVKRVKQRKNDT